MVTITKQDNAIIFAFTDSQYYLFGTGSIEVPMNALSLVIDESDMITFRKASSNDIFVSVPLDETNFSTKADVIDFYKENMVGSSGSADAFTGVSYDSTNQEIIFTNEDDETVATLDASAFVIDGMVENVKVENGYLVIDFNTASGKQDIYIPLTSFFDASQYYTKTEVDNLLPDMTDYYDKTETDNTFLSIAAYNPKEQAIAEALTDLNEKKADKTELPDMTDYYDKTEVDNLLPDMTDYYDKTETDNTFLTKAVFDVKEETISRALNELEDNKQDTLIAGTNITIENNVISSTGGSSSQVQSDWNQTDTTAVDYIKNKPNMANYYTKTEVDAEIENIEQVVSVSLNDFADTLEQDELVTSQALTNLSNTKADKTELPDMTDYYDKTETDTAISTAIATIDLSGYVDKTTFDVKEEVISRALNALNSEIGDINTILQSI